MNTTDIVIATASAGVTAVALLVWAIRVSCARMVGTTPTAANDTQDTPPTGTRYVLHIPAPSHLPALGFVVMDAPETAESEARNA